jgi:excisionase family DNA binding protein
MQAGSLTLQEAADELGVHYQTAYGWVRSGRLRAALIKGSYTLASEDVARLGAERARPRRPRPIRPRSGMAALSERALGHLSAGEERRARRLVAGLVRDGLPVATISQAVLAPALRHIGEQWSAGRLSVSVEHRAAAIAERILGEHQPAPRGRRRGVAAVAALSGDRHVLATAMAAVALREDGWTVHHLGADVPAGDLIGFCEAQSVDLAVLSLTTGAAAAATVHTAELMRADGLPALVGGPGRGLDELQRLARESRGSA